jgi:hypothetical protein
MRMLWSPALVLLGSMISSAALARGGTNAEYPWNAHHFGQLPPEIRSAVARLCANPRAGHEFATYTGASITLHYENFRCAADGAALCTAAGCLHQVYGLAGGRYRLLRSSYVHPGH